MSSDPQPEDVMKQRMEDYRAGYSAGYAQAQSGEPAYDEYHAHLFFGLPTEGAPLTPAVLKAMARFHQRCAEVDAAKEFPDVE